MRMGWQKDQSFFFFCFNAGSAATRSDRAVSVLDVPVVGALQHRAKAMPLAVATKKRRALGLCAHVSTLLRVFPSCVRSPCLPLRFSFAAEWVPFLGQAGFLIDYRTFGYN